MNKKELLIKLPIKFFGLIALVAIVVVWGNVNIPFFIIGLSTVFLAVVLSQVIVVFAPEARRKQDGHEQFTWASLIPGLASLPPHVSNGIIVSIMLLVSSSSATCSHKEDRGRHAARREIDLQEPPRAHRRDDLGDGGGDHGTEGQGIHAHHRDPRLFILFNNLSGLVPGFMPATDNVNTTFACSLTVFVLTHYYGIREHGIKYVKHFMGPVWWLAPIMIPIEVIGHLSRPLSLGLRLFGNIMGDHLVTGIFFMLIPLFVPLIGMVLGTFVALVQAFVFILLSMAYFSGAVAHEEH